MKDKIPHFIIVGTMKSGTTTLMHHIRNHKKMHTPNREMHFFNQDRFYKKGLDWYKKQLLKNISPEAKVVGEKTPTYSYQENVAKRIYDNCPDTKIIWVFRNPVYRTYSNYLHAYKKGVDLLTFEEAIEQEEERVKQNIFLGYKTRSMYWIQVKRFLQYFPKEQMFFLLFEDLIQPFSSDHILHDFFKFLGISEEGFTDIEEPRNKTKLPRFPKSLYYPRQWGWMKSNIIAYPLYFLNFYGKTPGYPKISPQAKETLFKFFEPHNKELEPLIDKDLSIWNK